jgi:hypothetical protein
MKTTYHILLALVGICLCVASCTHKNGQTEDEILTDKTFQAEVNLVASDSFCLDQVFRLYEFRISNGQMTVVDGAQEDTTINVFSYPDGAKLHGRYSYGEGPDQFIVVNSGEAKDINNVLIYDMMKHKMFIVDTSQNPVSIVKEYSLPLDENGRGLPYTYINQYNDSLFVMKYDDHETSARQLANLKTGEILWSQKVPYRTNPKFNYTAYDYFQRLSDSTAIAAYLYLDLVEIYNVSEKNGMQLKAKYGVVNELSPDEELQQTYQFVAHDKTAFYCLRANIEEELGTEVESYDIVTCRPLKKYILDKPIARMSIYDGHLVGYYAQEELSMFYIWKL